MADPVDVIAAGLSAARLRVNVLASNLANAETTHTPEGGPYKRHDVVQTAKSFESEFSSALDRATMSKPVIAAVIEDNTEPRKVFQPGHPDADQNGYVAYPNINVVTTMTDLMSASRLYQANATALETVRQVERDARTISTN